MYADINNVKEIESTDMIVEYTINSLMKDSLYMTTTISSKIERNRKIHS